MSGSVRAEPVGPPSIPLPEAFASDVVVLPREVAPDGRGLYDDSVLMAVKEFRALGVSASYQHDQESRTWVGEKAVAEVAFALIIGIASNAGWAALCRILRRQHGSDHVRVRVGRLTRTSTETSWEWFKVEGPGEAVADALAAIQAPGAKGVEVEQEEGAKNLEQRQTRA
jgi:hypothetical protein